MREHDWYSVGMLHNSNAQQSLLYFSLEVIYVGFSFAALLLSFSMQE